MAARPLTEILAQLPPGVTVTGRVPPAPDEDNPPMSWYMDRELIHPTAGGTILPAEGRTLFDSIATSLYTARELLYR